MHQLNSFLFHSNPMATVRLLLKDANIQLTSPPKAQTPGFAAIAAPEKDQNLTAGETTTVIWDYDSKWPGEITIMLIGGPSSSTLSPVSNLTGMFFFFLLSSSFFSFVSPLF